MIDPNFYTTQHIELEVAELDIDEGLKDCILATLERYNKIDDALKVANQTNSNLFNKLSDLQNKLAEIEKQEEPIKWQSTTEVYTPYITQSRYEKLRPEFQKWYRPYVAVQQSPAISKMETTANGLNLRLIEDCLLIYKTQLYFDDYSELRNKVTDQINILAKLNKQGA